MVEILEESSQLVVRIGGQEYARYHYGRNAWKPYLYPLRAANGLSLLADAPTDHRHHHGLWFGHGRVNDEVDCWLERHNSGRILHQAFTDVTTSSEIGGFTETCVWEDNKGRPVLTDTRTFTFHDTPPEARLFDIEIVLSAPERGRAVLHPTNEAGLPHLRAAEGLSVKTGGVLTNAGGKTNERGTYRQRSPWLDCSGRLGRQACGFAVFDHPDNPDSPTPWFTRDYGPFSPNYLFFAGEPVEITPDAPLRLRYRVFSHSGDVNEADVAGVYEAYAEAAHESEASAPSHLISTV